MRSAVPRGVLMLVVLVLASLSLNAIPATAALDPSDYTVRKLDIPISGDTPGLGGGSVGCGAGKRVVSGGAYWHRPGEGPDPSLNAYLSSSSPTPNGKRWFAAGVNWDGDLILAVVALCLPARAVGDYVVRTTELTVGDNTFASDDRRCGPGRRVVTGGAYWHEPGQPADPAVEGYLRSSTPDADGKGWYAVGYNDQAELRLTVIVLCLPKARVGAYVLRKVDVPIGDDASGGDAKKCRAGERVVPGGAFWHRPGEGRDPALEAWLRASVPQLAGRRWYAGGINNAGQELRLRVVGLCLAG